MGLDRFIVFVEPWAVAAAFAWTAAAAAVDLERPRVSQRGWIALVAAIIVYSTTRHWIARDALLYLDDYDHVDIAANLSRLGAFAQTWAGGRPDWTVLKPPCWPAGLHVLLAPVFKVFGAGAGVAVAFNAFVGSFCVAASFFLGLELFDDQAAAAAAAFLAATLPSLLAVSRSTGLSALSFFWLLLSLLAFSRWRRRRSLASYALLWGCVASATQTRPENLLLYGLLGAPAFFDSLEKRSRRWLVVDAAAALSLLAVCAILWRNRLEGQDSYDATALAALANLRRNLPGDLAYFFFSTQLLIGTLAVYGSIKARTLRPEVPAKTLAALAGAFLLFLAAAVQYDFFFWNGLKHALSVQAALLPLSAAGAAALARRFPLRAGTLLVVALSWSSWRGLGAHERGLAVERERDAFLAAADGFLPSDAFVITHLAASVLVRARRPAVDARLAVEDWRGLKSRAVGTTLVLFRDYWAPTQPDTSRKLERLIASDYTLAPIREIALDGSTYGFYRLAAKRR